MPEDLKQYWVEAFIYFENNLHGTFFPRSFGKRFELPEGLEEVEPQALQCYHESQHFWLYDDPPRSSTLLSTLSMPTPIPKMDDSL